MDNQIDAPPCVQLGQPMNHCARAQYSERILGNIALVGDWKDWRFKGRDLVSPDGHRISPERLRGVLMNEAIAVRIAKARKQKEQALLDAKPDNVLRPCFRKSAQTSA